ncbi:(d)CMP kinase [Natronobiforma cellulositropha]|uniref:(d)CMP kinase n=1 Tax=Natronobiforma cellulositropha TaxID=1679076 RepID=UPI0021D603D5|nr:AAA family ATPase [Natronobiforma cellulositropha]
MLLTVSGPPGGGKTTNAELLAERFGLEHVSGGDIFRELAAENDCTPLEFNKLAEDDEEIDRDLDRRLRELAVDGEDLVLESRLAGWLAGEHADLRFWLDAPPAVRGERIADREDKDPAVALEETQAREESEILRYREYYGIDFTDLRIYDLAINTGRWSPDAVIETLADAVEAYENQPDADEGAYPITGVSYEF